jgi:uncharacterized protein YjlB
VDPDAPQTLRFADDGAIPNSELPVLLYRGVPEVVDGAAACEALFARSGWGAMWRDGIYPFHHFHSTAHEALGIAAGRVTVGLGGPQGESIELAAGDVAILPAGTGHRNEGDSGDLLVIGAYPRGQAGICGAAIRPSTTWSWPTSRPSRCQTPTPSTAATGRSSPSGSRRAVASVARHEPSSALRGPLAHGP